MTFEEAKQVRIACLSHAKELLTEAERMADSHPHLAYHLTTLALEEIGKTVQVFIEALPAQRPTSDKPIWADRDDHVQKLFWALWSPLMSQESLQPNHLDWCRDFSKEIHQLRLGGLYVDWANGHLSKPRDVISKVQAEKLLGLAKVRLELALMEKPTELDEEKRSLLSWFTSAAWDEEKTKLIFGKKSLAKLTELKNPADWFKWLREQFADAEQEAKRLLKQELEKLSLVRQSLPSKNG